MKDASVESARFEPTVFGAVRRYRILVVVFALAGMMAAVGYTLHHGKTYAGKASVTVSSSLGGQAVDSEVLIMESPAVAQLAASIANNTLHEKTFSAQNFYAGGGSLTLFPPAGAAAGSYGASIIGVAFTSSSPRVAQVGANALLQAFNQQRSATVAAQYNKAIAGIDQAIISTTTPDQRAALQAQRDQQIVNEQVDLSQLPTVDWATEPTSPANGSVKKTAAEGLVIGLVLGVAAAYVRASRRQGFIDQQDPGALYGVPLIGEIPAFKAEKALRSNRAAADGLPIRADPHSAVAEAFRFAAGSVERIRAEWGPKLSLVFVSPLASTGMSMVVANLALAIAEGGTRVLVVDANAGNGGLTTRLLLGTSADDGGLEQVLTGQQPLATYIHPSPLNDAVAVLGSGPVPHRRVTGAARAKAASALLAKAKSSFDIILIDSPGLLQVADAAELVAAADAAIIVLGPKELTRDHVETADRLKFIGSVVVGYIYDGAPTSAPRARYQRNGSSARQRDLVPPASSANGSSARQRDSVPPTGDFPTLALERPHDGGSSLSTELRIDKAL
jgi:Mrp family chromosome partitioning ATPase